MSDEAAVAWRRASRRGAPGALSGPDSCQELARAAMRLVVRTVRRSLMIGKGSPCRWFKNLLDDGSL